MISSTATSESICLSIVVHLLSDHMVD